MSITINTLESSIKSGPKDYPIFIGFLEASELLKIAEVPNFAANTPHLDIAGHVLSPPVKDWQRPLIVEKKKAISSVYDDTGEFMPNPVLLSGNYLGNTPLV